MECPRCNFSIDNSNYCVNCKSDMFIIRRAVSASNRYYNRGLSQAKDNDLSGAIISLNKSLIMNKNNITARNLLGLIYHEIGYIGDALKQWVISSSFSKMDNPAEKYIALVKNNGKEMEKTDDAVHMYNQALVYLQQRSEDMAIIQLKKALEYSPGFIEAKNLLAFCYITEKSYAKAKLLIDKVLSQDSYNAKALFYQKSLDLPRQRTEVRESQTNVKAVEKNKAVSRYAVGGKKSGKSIFPVNEILSFIIGAMCTTAVIYVLLIPNMETQSRDRIVKLEKELAETKTGVNREIQTKDDNMSELQIKYDELAGSYDSFKLEKETLEKNNAVLYASYLYSNGDSAEAAKLMYDMDENGLSQAYRSMYNELAVETYGKVAQDSYNLGVNEYNTQQNRSASNRNYDAALESLATTVKYAESNVNFTRKDDLRGDAYFYLGRISHNLNETEKAREYYQKTIDLNAGNNVQNARSRINQL